MTLKVIHSTQQRAQSLLHESQIEAEAYITYPLSGRLQHIHTRVIYIRPILDVCASCIADIVQPPSQPVPTTKKCLDWYHVVSAVYTMSIDPYGVYMPLYIRHFIMSNCYMY